MSEKPLTDEEIKVLRELAVSSQRTKWLVAGVRQVALWIGIVVGGYLAFKGAAADFILWGSPK